MSPNPIEEAQLLIDTFADRNGEDESNLRDILTDLMLWAEQHGRSFGDELTQALNTWLAEGPQANDAVLPAWATTGHPFADDDAQVTLEENIAQILADAQDNAIADLSDDEYGPDRLFHEEDLMRLGRQIGRLLTVQPASQPLVSALAEALSNTTAALETMLTWFKERIPAEDARQREKLVEQSRALLTTAQSAELTVEEWFQAGELASDLERVGVTTSEILEGMGALLDRANTCEIPGDVLFRASDGKLYTVHVEAEIVEVAPDDDWALETIAAAREAGQEVTGEIADADDQPPAWVDRHSVNCADCGELVDERDGLMNPDDEGEVCSRCLDKRDAAARSQIIAAARAQYAREGSIEIDEDAVFSRGEEAGMYVAAWVWVPWPAAEQSDENDDLFCTCDCLTATHVEGQFQDRGEICDECGKPLPLTLQS